MEIITSHNNLIALYIGIAVGFIGAIALAVFLASPWLWEWYKKREEVLQNRRAERAATEYRLWNDPVIKNAFGVSIPEEFDGDPFTCVGSSR